MGKQLAMTVQTRRVWCYAPAGWCLRLGAWLAKQAQVRMDGRPWESQVKRVEINFDLGDKA